jgi:hypothetical protein
MVRRGGRGLSHVPFAPVSAVPLPDPVRDLSVTAGAVLVVGTDQWAIEQAGGQLRAAGRRVLRCHEPGEPAFPCNALLPGRRCPLDDGIDVVLDIRARPVNPPALSEFGAVCALHAGVPLVVAGVPGDSGFGPWAASAVENGVELTAACDEAAAQASIA